MNISGIILAVVVIGGIGLFVALFLGIAAIQFKVEVDEREVSILEALPGNNCGGCGYAGCSGLAAAILKGEAEVNACPVGGDKVATTIGSIMGVEANTGEKMVAFVKCSGSAEITKNDYDYSGIEDCRMLSFVPNGGPKSCNYGCLGYGTCAKVCPFQAIEVVDGVAKVNKDLCKACKKCIAVCPKQLIELVPYQDKHYVSCNSKEKGPITMKVCQVGCIGCGICVKNCPEGAIIVQEAHAHIDYQKCTGCGICKEKCPKKSII